MLLRRGYDVAIGKIDAQEVDFIARKVGENSISGSQNPCPRRRHGRELTPLQKIRDNHRKTVLVLDGRTTKTDDGIKIAQVQDFLLE